MRGMMVQWDAIEKDKIQWDTMKKDQIQYNTIKCNATR